MLRPLSPRLQPQLRPPLWPILLPCSWALLTRLLGLGVLLDDGDDGVGDGGLVLEAALVAQHRRQEVHQHAVLARELEAQRLDGLATEERGTVSYSASIKSHLRVMGGKRQVKHDTEAS